MAMLSGVAAGLLRVGAVALTAGGLATGIYFAVQVGQDESGDTAQAPAATSTALSPPNEVVARPTITPTYILAPSPTPPTGVDTSDWKTYAGAEGFSFKYPPDWRLDVLGDGVRILNAVSQQVYDDAAASGHADIARVEGMAEFTASIFSNRFNADALSDSCERSDPLGSSEDPPGAAEVTTFAGMPAVQCRGISIYPSGLESTGLSYWIQVTPDLTAQVGGGVSSAVPEDFPILEAFIASFTVQPR